MNGPIGGKAMTDGDTPLTEGKRRLDHYLANVPSGLGFGFRDVGRGFD